MKKTKKLIIFGNTNYSEMICDYFEEYTEYEVCAFTVHEKYKKVDSYYGKLNISFEEITNVCNPSEYDMFVAIGSLRLNKVRADICKQAIQKGYNLATFIHPDAYIGSKVTIGKNCVIMECCKILSRTTIGDNVVVWPIAFISHNNVIKDNVYIVGSTNGFCEVGENTFIGAGAMVADKVKIAKDNFITMSAVVRMDTEEDSIYEGIPAKKRERISATKFTELFY